MCLEISRQLKGPATVFFKARPMFSKSMVFRACSFFFEPGGRMMVLVTLRRQKVCVALRALTGYFSYINTELCLTLFLKKKNLFPLRWKWWLHKSWYLLWAMLWGFILWHRLLTFLSWGVFCRDPFTACQRSPEDTAGDAGGPSLRTESWVTVLTLASSASVPHPKVSTIG